MTQELPHLLSIRDHSRVERESEADALENSEESVCAELLCRCGFRFRATRDCDGRRLNATQCRPDHRVTLGLEESFRKRTDLRQPLQRLHRIGGQRNQYLVLQERTGRQIGGPRAAVTPKRQFPENGHVSRRKRPRSADAQELRVRVKPEQFRRAGSIALFHGGRTMPERVKTCEEFLHRLRKVADIVRRVTQLAVGERPLIPVAETEVATETRTGQFGDQLLERYRIRKTRKRRRYLRIQYVGRRTAQVTDNRFDILRASVNNLEYARIRKQLPERRQIQPGERIDERYPILRCHLHEAEFGKVTRLADELAVVGKCAVALELREQLHQAGLRVDKNGIVWNIVVRVRIVAMRFVVAS